MRAAAAVAPVEPHEIEHLADPGGAPAHSAGQAERDVVGDGEVGEQGAVLRDVADRAPIGRELDASGVGDDVAPDRDRSGVGLDEPDPRCRTASTATGRARTSATSAEPSPSPTEVTVAGHR